MKTSHKAATAGGVIACCVAFTPILEGIWTTAQVDKIGTGHPVTYCYGQTTENGAVQVGEKFTPRECKKLLAQSLPKYLARLDPCIHVALPDKTRAALLDAAYNAGSAAVCRSPMVKRMNAGNIRGGCMAFAGWYVRANGRVVKGLINRRVSERALCLEGLTQKPKPEPSFWAVLLSYFKRG